MVAVSEGREFHYRLTLSERDKTIKQRIDSMTAVLEEKGPLVPIDLLKSLDPPPKKVTFYRDVKRMLIAGSGKLVGGRLATHDYSNLSDRILRMLKLTTYCDINSLQLYDADTHSENPQVILEKVGSRIGEDPESKTYREAFYKTYRKLLLRVQERRDAGAFQEDEWGRHLLFFDDPDTGRGAYLT
jgi:hypothetical protein